MDLQEKVKSLGLSLPEASMPGGNYVSVNVRGKIAYVAIQFPILNGIFLHLGRLGAELTTEEGSKAMQLCAFNVLVQVNKHVGIQNIEGLNHIDACYQAAKEWDEAPLVLNGASDLFTSVLGDKGQHSRSLFGVDKLPRNFSVGLTSTFTIV